MIYGAIIGDIAGSRFEFDRGGKTKEFEMFTADSTFTDDTVMTIAVANALLRLGEDADEEQVKNTVIAYMQKWGRKYPNAGYGAKFIHWIFAEDPQPYGSFGNGSAMRTSSVGWLYDDLDRTRQVARWVAEVSHNHPEGVKGAECTATVIWMARNGFRKEDIKQAVTEIFEYDISRSVDELRPFHEHIETCMDSMPKALASFFEGESYEDVIRNAISLGGDTDTLAAIAGAMAEAYYGVPAGLIERVRWIIPTEMLSKIDLLEELNWDRQVGK